MGLSVKNSKFWKRGYFEVFHLKKNKRALPDEKLFAKYLRRMGDGDLEIVDGADYIEIPDRCLIKEDEETVSDDEETDAGKHLGKNR